MSFPDGFLWGAATSAFQIEGSLDADGRGRSIWDGFAGESGDLGTHACDHYRRWREDVDLLARARRQRVPLLACVAAPLPDGRGSASSAASTTTTRLIDALLEKDIEPLVTLYHWDLPQALQDEGGWRNRETVDAFAEYARACFDAYGDRVMRWCTINEPWVHGILGHADGLHAPGEKDLRGALQAIHHMLLAHGRAAGETLRRARSASRSASFRRTPRATPTPIARPRCICDGYHNRWFLDAVLKGAYPDDMRALFEERSGRSTSSVTAISRDRRAASSASTTTRAA